MPKVRIHEFNTSAQTQTSGITSLSLGSSDKANLTAGSYGVKLSTTTTTYSYEKWLRLVVTDLEGYSSVNGIKVYAHEGSLAGSDTLKTNAGIGGSYSLVSSFSTPVSTVSSKTPNNFPFGEPGNTNLGINGSLTGSISNLSTLDRSDFLVIQLGVDKDTRGGSQLGFTFSWVENA